MTQFTENNPLVRTIKNLCRVCYTCVRECPAKAIRILNGQAEVMNDRCIGCGNCVVVCSQGAKAYYSSIPAVEDLLANNNEVIACIAPSFPAEFLEIEDYRTIVGMIKKLGFKHVTEVAFGADLVALKYKEIFDDPDALSIITSDCPATTYYIRQYNPELVPFLAKIDSPAMAMAKVVREIYGNEPKLVFIGPCTAKKAESNLFEEVLTFSELRKLFKKHDILPEDVEKNDFDAPVSGPGAIFPVNHGLLETISKKEGLGQGQVYVAEGKNKFKEALAEFQKGLLKNQHLELLCCDGCIQGAGLTNTTDVILKRMKVHQYVEQKMKNLDKEEWKKNIEKYQHLDFTRNFEPIERLSKLPPEEKIKEVLASMGKKTENDILNCGACGYLTCREYAIAVTQGMADFEMCLPYTIEKMHRYNRKLQEARQALKQSEKLASMGQVSAGIAHELNNPLGVITLYSSILMDDSNPSSQLFQDLRMINDQAERCRKIVGGLLNFARKSQVRLSETDIVSFIETSLKSVLFPENVKYEFYHNLEQQNYNIDKDQMMQAITNLEKNAIEAMPNGGILKVELSTDANNLIINIIDSGTGIADENLEKIFTPFFTTKEVGKGTGLGLPLVYGIVKMHKGQINIKSNAKPEKGQTGTTFTITIPKNLKIE